MKNSLLKKLPRLPEKKLYVFNDNKRTTIVSDLPREALIIKYNIKEEATPCAARI